jgi:hypothetical protein
MSGHDHPHLPVNPDHERAAGLLAEQAIEGIEQSDAFWLEQHLAECSECSGYAGTLGLARQALRSISVTASDELVAATKARVRIRALELRERTARAVFIGVSSFIGAALSSISLYYAWPVVRWLETHFELPAIVVEPGFVMAWFLPTMIAAAMLAATRSQARHAEAVAASEEGSKGVGYGK